MIICCVTRSTKCWTEYTRNTPNHLKYYSSGTVYGSIPKAQGSFTELCPDSMLKSPEQSDCFESTTTESSVDTKCNYILVSGSLKNSSTQHKYIFSWNKRKEQSSVEHK